MKISLLLLFGVIISTSGLFAQKDADGVRSNTFAIKGKILPWTVLVLPFSGVNYTLGAEYGFARHNAIGVELVYNDNVTHKDYTTSATTDSAGSNAFAVSRGVFLYYRRYLNLEGTILNKPMNKLTGDSYLPYLSCFVRYGKKDYHYDMGFETANVTYDEWQYSGGVLFGAICGVFDVNMGPFYKQSYVSDVEKEAGGNVLYSHMRPSFGYRIGVNLFLALKQKGDHDLAKYAASF